MFDAVIVSPADPEAAARTFAGLVEGVVDGIVRRAVLISSGQGDGLSKLADAAGCRLLAGVPAGQFGDALRPHLATPHILVFAAGALPPPGWPDLLQHEFQRCGLPGPDGGFAFRPADLGPRLKLMAAFSLRQRVPLDHGALLPRDRLTDSAFDGRSVKAKGPVHLMRMTVQRMQRPPA